MQAGLVVTVGYVWRYLLCKLNIVEVVSEMGEAQRSQDELIVAESSLIVAEFACALTRLETRRRTSRPDARHFRVANTYNIKVELVLRYSRNCL